MKYAVTDYDGCEYITAGKRYEVIYYDGVYFYAIDNHGDRICTSVENSNHLDGNDWRIIEMNNDIEQQGNDFEVKYDDVNMPDEIWAYEEYTGIVNGHWFKNKGNRNTKYIRADLVSQKQPETSDVTRSDIELRDWYAGQALQGMLASPNFGETVTEQAVSNMAYEIATAMMEARKNK